MKYFSIVLLVQCSLFAAFAADDPRLVIHEWGTFTSLQNDAGRALGGINVDDERLPRFVKTIGQDLVAFAGNKGFAFTHPDIAMRLETPVVYFHPAKAQALPMTLDFEVGFKGGWLTQFYPNAAFTAPGFSNNELNPGRISAATFGTLAWRGLKLGVDAPVPVTKFNVWTAPRAVDAATVVNGEGQAEKFLFYRGVGNIAAPLKVVRPSRKSGELLIQSQLDKALDGAKGMDVRTLWLAHFRPDGTCAFSVEHPSGFLLNSPEFKKADAGLKLNADFSPGQYGKENLTALKKSMRESLIADGLFADEADALLNTWETSYFKSAGLRLFFLVPHAWTDHYLPVKVSVPSDISRVMVGRIELLSPEQDGALDQLAAATDFSDAGIQRMWPMIKTLGRFTTPLLLERLKNQSSPGIQEAAKIYAMPVYDFSRTK